MSKIAQLLQDVPSAGGRAEKALTTAYGNKINVENARNDDERDLLADTAALFEQIDQAGGVEPATFINMHPWEIRSTGPHLTGIVVPACPIGQPFVQYVQRDIRIDRADKGGRFAITPVWPIMLMRDALRQHEHWGGMVVYMGEARIGESRSLTRQDEIIAALIDGEKDPEKRELLKKLRTSKQDNRYASVDEVKRMMEHAEERQIAYYRARCTVVGTAYASDAKTAYRQITPVDRLMARWLNNRGIYATLPPWVTEERPDSYKPKVCAKCGADVDPKGFGCPKCGYIHDGIKAFSAGEIGEEHVALKRHSREELDAAGLKHIKTLTEDRAEAEKAKAKAARGEGK